MVIIGVAPVLSWLIIASVLKAMGQGTGQISLQTECIKRVDPGRIGVAMSTFYIGADIGQGLGPILGGELSERFNYMVMYSTCATFLLCSMLIFNLYQRQKARS
jgi:predicted MFS family arabinose efflux permease